MALQNKFSDYEQAAQPAKAPRNQVLEGLGAFSAGQELGANISNRFIETQELMRARALRDAAGKVLQGAMGEEAKIDGAVQEDRANIKTELDAYVKALKTGNPQPPKAAPSGEVSYTTGEDGERKSQPVTNPTIETDHGPISLSRMLLLGREKVMMETDITNKKRDMWFKVMAENADNPTVVSVAKAKVSELMEQDGARLKASEFGWNNAANIMNAEKAEKPPKGSGSGAGEDIELWKAKEKFKSDQRMSEDGTKRGRKAETDAGELSVPVRITTGDGKADTVSVQALDKDSKKKFVELNRAADDMDRLLTVVEGYTPGKRKGGWSPATAERARQAAVQLQIAWKQMANLGTLSEGDKKLMEAVIPTDPGGMSDFAGKIAARIEGMRRDVEANRVFAKRNYLRGAPETEQEASTASGQESSQGPQGEETQGMTERLDRKTGKVALFDAKTKKFVRFK